MLPAATIATAIQMRRRRGCGTRLNTLNPGFTKGYHCGPATNSALLGLVEEGVLNRSGESCPKNVGRRKRLPHQSSHDVDSAMWGRRFRPMPLSFLAGGGLRDLPKAELIANVEVIVATFRL